MNNFVIAGILIIALSVVIYYAFKVYDSKLQKDEDLEESVDGFEEDLDEQMKQVEKEIEEFDVE